MVSPRPTGTNGFTIEVGCPGCGADLALERDFRLLNCRHCGSVLRILMPDLPPAFFVRPKKSAPEVRFLLDRHLREQGFTRLSSTAPCHLTYFPYWKIDAVTLKVRTSTYEVDHSSEDNPDDSQVEERELTTVNLTTFSTTLPAASTGDSVPFSLGVRTGYLGLVPFIADKVEEASCVAITRPFEDALHRALTTTAAMGKLEQSISRAHNTQLFHPRGSIVYFPYYLFDTYEKSGIRRYALDGVTGRVGGSELLEESAQADTPAEPIRFGSVGVEFHRCTNCGIDLPMSQSSVYQCHNCQRVEFLEQHRSLDKQLLVTLGKRDPNATLFPFWVIRARTDVSDKDLRFVVPAFEMRNAESVYRLSSRMSTAIQHIPTEPSRDLIAHTAPASRSIEDALTLLEVLWYRRAAERDVVKNRVYQPCTPESVQLLYVPFVEQQYFYVDTVLNAVTFEKAAALAPTA